MMDGSLVGWLGLSGSDDTEERDFDGRGLGRVSPLLSLIFNFRGGFHDTFCLFSISSSIEPI